MDRDFVQCVGEVPWFGFFIGCLLIGLAIASFIIYFIVSAKWYKNWRRKVRSKPDYYMRKSKRERITDKIGEVLAVIVLGSVALTLGSWIIWGFIRAIMCFMEN